MNLWLDREGRWLNRQQVDPFGGLGEGGVTTQSGQRGRIPPYPTEPAPEGMFYDLLVVDQEWVADDRVPDGGYFRDVYDWVEMPIQGYQQWLAEQEGTRRNQLLSLVSIFSKLSLPAKSRMKDVLKTMGVDLDQLMGGAARGFEPTVTGAPRWMPAGMPLGPYAGGTRGRGEDVLGEDVAALLAWALAQGRGGRPAPTGVRTPFGRPPPLGQPPSPLYPIPRDWPPLPSGAAIPSGALLPSARLPLPSIGFPRGFDPRALATGVPVAPKPQADLWAPYRGLAPEELFKVLGL